MKANKFVKENGIEKCKRILDDLTDQGHTGYFYKELKRLVESHELVESCGGLVEIKSQLKQGVFVGYEKPLVRQAIADVESCQ